MRWSDSLRQPDGPPGFTDVVLQEDAKIGIFAASIAAAIVGSSILAAAHRRASPKEQALEEAEAAELFAEDPQVVVAAAESS